MERISLNHYKLIEFLENLNPKSSGIFFSIFLHLLILLFAVGIPNFFNSNNKYIPNIVPIEILNVSDVTNTQIDEKKIDLKKTKKTLTKKKVFNSSENTEIQKNTDLKENFNEIEESLEQPVIKIKEKSITSINEKKIEIKQKDKIDIKNIETIKTDKIKPKLKPNKNKLYSATDSDIQISNKTDITPKAEKKDIITEPKKKPKEDFNIASMLKDLRNEKSNNLDEENIDDEEESQNSTEEINENITLSISEIDLLRQQLSSCWNAPAGAVIERGMKVTISAKVQQNMKVLGNSVRIVDTNISKSNPFYAPITDSAMRTLLNPECTPLKLPENKYNLWKSLTITFDYSIMKGL